MGEMRVEVALQDNGISREDRSFRLGCDHGPDGVLSLPVESVRCCICGVDYIQARAGPLELGTELCAEHGARDALEWWPAVAADLPDTILKAVVSKWEPPGEFAIWLKGDKGHLEVTIAFVFLEDAAFPVVGALLTSGWNRDP